MENVFIPLQAIEGNLLTLIACFLLLISWRVYRFTITPWLHPENPKELPYWIPFLGEYPSILRSNKNSIQLDICLLEDGLTSKGHAVGFYMNANDILERGRVYFGDTKALYSITLAGETLCVITGVSDIQELYRNSSTITWDNLIKDMYSFTPKNHTRSAHEMTSEYHRQQLLTAVNSENLVQQIIPGLEKSLSWNILRKHPACIRTSGDSITLSLWNWCNEVIIKSSATAYYGPKIFEINPNLLQAMMSWEATNWKFMYKLTDFMARDIINARSEFIDTLCKYFETPKKDRSDALYFVTAMEEEMRAAGLSDRETAGIHMLHLWAITANVYKAAFWAIAHIVHRPELLAQIRAEIAPAIGTNGESVDLKYLTEDCPRLEAFFNEVLRINSAGALAREVITPTLFSGKILAKGTKLMIPYRQLHLDGQAWGPSARDFDPERFLKDKSLTRSQNFRPFGGGHTLCPGRFIAKKSVYTIVALIFSRYDVTLDTDAANQKFPRIDDATAGIGTMAPMPGEDVKLLIKPASN